MNLDRVAHPAPARVLCVAPHPLQASLLAGALETHGEVQVVGKACDLRQALAYAEDAEVVVLQPGQLPDGGTGWLAAIADAHPHVRLVLLDTPHSEAQVVACVEAGAMGCVMEGQELKHLVQAIGAVQRGQAFLPATFVPALLHRFASLRRAQMDPQTAARRVESLTPREQEVLGMLSQGLTNGAIAGRLRIAVGTVKNHVHSILHKLRASGRWEAAACLEIAVRGGGLEMAWPLAWTSRPTESEAELPLRASPAPEDGERRTDRPAHQLRASPWRGDWRREWTSSKTNRL